MKTLFKSILLVLSLILFSCGGDDTPESTPNIDLKVDSYELSKVNTSQFAGVVTIMGIVKNIGDDYVSSDGQQTIYIFRRNLGATGQGTLVEQKDFTNINAGETVEISYNMNWNSSTEFPPEYIIQIGYDPDIYIDGNKHNDDTNHDNDEIVISGYDINDLFN